MANITYNYGIYKFVSKAYTLGSTSFNIMLLKSTYVPSKAHRSLAEIVTGNEVSGTRKSYGVLTGTIDDTGNRVKITGPGNMAWTGLSATGVRYALLYLNTGTDSTSIPVYLVDLNSNRNPTSSLTISFTSNWIFSIQCDEDPTLVTFIPTMCYTNGGKLKIFDGTIDLINDTLKIMLLKTSYSVGIGEVDKDDCSSMTASECTGTGYTAGYGNSGRKTITNKSITVDDTNNRVVFSFKHPGYLNLDSIGNIGYAVLIKETGGSDSTAIPIAIFKPVTDIMYASSKGDLDLNFHLAGAIHFKED